MMLAFNRKRCIKRWHGKSLSRLMFERIVMNYVDALLFGYEGVLDGHVGSFLCRDLRQFFHSVRPKSWIRSRT